MIRFWHWVIIILASLAVAAGQVLSTVWTGAIKTGGIALALVGGAALLGVFARVAFSGLPRKRTDKDRRS